MLVGDDVVDLLLVPVAGVGERDLWRIYDADRLEFSLP